MKSALRIVDADGLEGLSMRKLGAALGVDPMAIYYHLPNKAALYDAIVEAVMAEMNVPHSPAGESAIERLAHMAHAYKDSLLAHPNAIPVVAARPVRTPGSLRPVEWMLAVIMGLGFSSRRAIAFVDACAHFIMGWAMTYVAHLQDSDMHRHSGMPIDELPLEEFPYLHRVLADVGTDDPFALEFEIGLDALLKGLLASKDAQ